MLSIVKKITIGKLTFVAVVCLVGMLNAQLRGGWEHLGSAHVDGRGDHDKIEVPGGSFTSLQMGVTNGSIGFERIVVHFRNGNEEVLPAAFVIRSGRRTPPIPLRGGAREISSVELWYAKGMYAQGKPRVDLFGKR